MSTWWRSSGGVVIGEKSFRLDLTGELQLLYVIKMNAHFFIQVGGNKNVTVGTGENQTTLFVGTGEWMRALQGQVGRLRDRVVSAVTGRPAPAEELNGALENSVERLLPAGEAYLEVGSLKGRSMAGALLEAPDRTFVAVESFREFGMLADASRLFSRVTRRTYRQLVQEDDGERIAVIDRRGVRKEVGDLSRGTAEQLYLCIRLALAREFAERSGALPLVIDDCLVNFDPARQAAMAQALGDYAEAHQVLVFTCHPSTRDLLLDVHPHARVITLGERKRPELVAVQQTLAV